MISFHFSLYLKILLSLMIFFKMETNQTNIQSNSEEWNFHCLFRKTLNAIYFSNSTNEIFCSVKSSIAMILSCYRYKEEEFRRIKKEIRKKSEQINSIHSFLVKSNLWPDILTMVEQFVFHWSPESWRNIFIWKNERNLIRHSQKFCIITIVIIIIIISS